MNKNFIAVTIGDINGIGIELLIKLFVEKKIKNFILFTNHKLLDEYLKKNKLKIKIKNTKNNSNIFKVKSNEFCIYDYKAKNNYENSYESLKESYKYAKKFNLKGIINLPLNKEKIIKNIDKKFIGQTEYYQQIDKKNISNMIFLYKNLIITILTTHIKLNKISNNLSKKNYIYDKIINLNKVLIKQLKIKKPKIIVSGINPHASENGMFGNEETKFLIPQINKLLKKNIFIHGPYSADSILNDKNINKYNCFVFCYHDQALVAYKYISKNRGINFTGGLSVLRVSPDHGTAYDLVGKNIAESKSLFSCYKFLNNF